MAISAMASSGAPIIRSLSAPVIHANDAPVKFPFSRIIYRFDINLPVFATGLPAFVFPMVARMISSGYP